MATTVDFSNAKAVLQELKEQLEPLAPQSSGAADALAYLNAALSSVNSAQRCGEDSTPPMNGIFAENPPG